MPTNSVGTCKLCGYEGPGPSHPCSAGTAEPGDIVEVDERCEVNWTDIPADTRRKVEVLTNLVFDTICALVDDEDAIRIQVHANHRRAQFTVRVSERDVAFAVGARGRHADALRILLIAACRKLQFHFDMDICGPSGNADWSSS